MVLGVVGISSVSIYVQLFELVFCPASSCCPINSPSFIISSCFFCPMVQSSLLIRLRSFCFLKAHACWHVVSQLLGLRWRHVYPCHPTPPLVCPVGSPLSSRLRPSPLLALPSAQSVRRSVSDRMGDLFELCPPFSFPPDIIT